MQRRSCTPRPDWSQRVEALGFDFHTIDNAPYWDESAYWCFTAAEIDELEAVAEELHQMYVQAAEHVIRQGLLPRLGITGLAADLVQRSWALREPGLYGRFDLAWTGAGPPKLLEYNADTPTSLFEASVIQWQWLRDFDPEADQFNSLHERLVERWQFLWAMLPRDFPLHLTCAMPHAEDEGTVRYLQATALEAGLATKRLPIDAIGWDGRQFLDLEDQPIRRLFKLYPWEWLAEDEFAANIVPAGLQVLEPAWKLLLSNKGLLAVLWQLFPDHPNLLPASLSPLPGRSVRKPLFSREGANITILNNGQPDWHVDGPYGAEGYVHQAWTDLADTGTGTGGRAVLGVWTVGDTACGLGIREDDGPVTKDTSRFVPHLFR